MKFCIQNAVNTMEMKYLGQGVRDHTIGGGATGPGTGIMYIYIYIDIHIYNLYIISYLYIINFNRVHAQ